MSTGAELAARRMALGLTLRQATAATRINARHLEALEKDDPKGFAAPVYANGYLRTYARFLGLDPEPLTLPDDGAFARERLALSLENPSRKRRAILTGPAVLAAVVVFVVAGVAGYAWRQVAADSHPGAALLPASMSSPAVTPAAVIRPIVVGLHVTEAVWIDATIDGKPQFGGSGTTLSAGSTVYFTGVHVRITSGKAAATLISIDGRNLGPLGTGVATRDFTSQTSS